MMALWVWEPMVSLLEKALSYSALSYSALSAARPTGEAPYCEAKNDERKWCQKEDRSHGLVSTADTAHQGRRKKNNAAKLSRLF